jgi:hypothetical protein
MSKRYTTVFVIAAFAVASCQSAAPTPVAPAGNAAAPVTAPPAPSRPTRDLGVIFGRMNLPSAIIASGGGNIIASGGGNIIAAGGGNIIASGGGNIIASGGGNIIAAGGGNIIAAGGGNIIASGGGNIIASGGGNIIASGGGNYHHLAVGADVIDALTVTPTSLVNPKIDASLSHPIAHAALMLTDADGHQLPGTPFAVTDDQGYYYFVGLPTDKPFVVTAPFLPSQALLKVGGTGIIASGGGNIIASGGGNVISPNGSNVISPNGSNVISPNGSNLQLLGGGWQLLSDAATGAASTSSPAPTVSSQVIKSSPKALSQPFDGATFQPISGTDGLANIQQQMAGLLAQLKGPQAAAYTTLADTQPTGVTPDNGDINIASTVTSNILLSGQKGKLATFDQAKFDLVAGRIANALLAADLIDVAQSIPVVPKLVAIAKLELPQESTQTFDKSDKTLIGLLLEEADKRKQIAALQGDAKARAEAELAALEAAAKDANDRKIAALFDLAIQLQKKLGLTVTTDNTPVGGGGSNSSAGSSNTSGSTTGGTTGQTNTPSGTTASQTSAGGGNGGNGGSTSSAPTAPQANSALTVQNGGVTDPSASEAVL